MMSPAIRNRHGCVLCTDGARAAVATTAPTWAGARIGPEPLQGPERWTPRSPARRRRRRVRRRRSRPPDRPARHESALVGHGGLITQGRRTRLRRPRPARRIRSRDHIYHPTSAFVMPTAYGEGLTALPRRTDVRRVGRGPMRRRLGSGCSRDSPRPPASMEETWLRIPARAMPVRATPTSAGGSPSSETKLHLTVADVAERAAMSPQYLRYLESSPAANPTPAILTRWPGPWRRTELPSGRRA